RPRCARRVGGRRAARPHPGAGRRHPVLPAPARQPLRPPARPRRPRGPRRRARRRGRRRGRPGAGPGAGRRVPRGGAMTGLLTLAARRAPAPRAVPVALILLVLLVAGVVTAWPRLLAGVDDRQTTHEISGASPLARDVVAVLPDRRPELAAPEPGTTPFEPAVEENLGGVLAALEELRAAQPEPLRSMLGDPQFWVEPVPFSVQPPPDPLMGTQTLTLKQDPQLADHVELVAGRWPEPPTPVDPYAGLTEQQRLALSLDEDTALVAAAIAPRAPPAAAPPAPAADSRTWEVSTERRGTGNAVPLLRAGTSPATAPDAGFWAHNPRSAAPHVVDGLNLRTSGTAAA